MSHAAIGSYEPGDPIPEYRGAIYKGSKFIGGVLSFSWVEKGVCEVTIEQADVARQWGWEIVSKVDETGQVKIARERSPTLEQTQKINAAFRDRELGIAYIPKSPIG